MQQVSDIILFQRIQQDDRLALNTLFVNYYQQLCRFACSLSLTHEQAEEAVADIFFAIWKNRYRLDIHSNVRAYLYKSVKHAALAVIRQNKAVEYTEVNNSIDYYTPEVEFEYHELTECLNRVVEKLPERCRQIFILNRFDGLKYKEISSILGLSEKTIEHQMVKALDIVRSALLRYNKHESLHNSITLS